MKSILITGANRGIGLEFVKILADGFSPSTSHIFACCRNPEGASELQEIKKKSKVNVHLLRLDVMNASDVQEVVAAVSRAVGQEGLNVLINNAGICSNAPGCTFPNITPEQMALHLSVNATSPFILAQAFLPLLRAASSASASLEPSCSRAAVICISAELGSLTNTTKMFLPYILPYKVSKAALNMSMRTLSEEVNADGILVVSVCPGWVKTDMGSQMAALTTEQSVTSMLNAMATLGQKDQGSFIDRSGKTIPW